ncbi:hypothetical protein KEM54_002774 [Ascosphaera aggregata]|nr:hypothetical protein KEM54_002774 [Ascosphaera aggregata]
METERANPVAASEEHDLAAAEFALTAEHCDDPQATRMLRLLENHHKQLAEVLKFQHKHSVIRSQYSDTPARLSVAADAPAKIYVPECNETVPVIQPMPPAMASLVHSRLGRSIASDLASARGIRRENAFLGRVSDRTTEAKQSKRSAPNTPSHKGITNRGTKKDIPSSRPKPSWAPKLEPPGVIYPPSDLAATKRDSSAKVQNENTSSDDPFNRFYSTFGGLISKISAPLAFAGLPLSGDLAQGKASPSPDPFLTPNDISRSSQGPDLTKLLSPAALRAIKDDNDSDMPAVNPVESFYVVPATGGTMSCAGIVAGDEKQQQRLHNSYDPENDFVDAQLEFNTTEVGNTTRTTTSTNRRAHSVSMRNRKTLEELQLENATLKQTSDDLARRLQRWEANSQSSHYALHQSLRAMQNCQTINMGSTAQTCKSPLSLMTPIDTEVDDPPDTSRVKELEQSLKYERENYERVCRENEKLARIVARYRDRWERLKAGARTRREANQENGKESDQSGVMEALPEGGSREAISEAVGAVRNAAQQY